MRNKVKLDAGRGENSVCPLSALLKRTNLDPNRMKQQNSQLTGRKLKDTEKLEKDCSCCMCEVSSSVMFSAKTNNSYNTAAGENSSCNSCSCSETSTNRTMESVHKCTCSKCVCPVCPGKPKQPSNQPAAAQVGDTAGNKLTNTSCNCEKCVCLVCPFKKTDINEAKASQTNKQTTDQGTGEGFKCDCSISTETSKVKTELSTQGTDCTCLLDKQIGDCKCDMCPDRTKIQPGLIKESLNCECTTCKCDPCADPKKSKGLGGSSGPDRSNITGDVSKLTCFCSVCRCSSCSDPTKSGVKENTAKGIDSTNGKHCKCNPCSDPSKLTSDVFKKPVACNCNQCVCNPCADVDKRKQMENQKEQGSDINKTGNTSNIGFQEYQRIPCNCAKCTCIFCNDPKGKEDPNVHQTKQGENCVCTVCICNDSNKSPPSSNPCNCTVCSCDPCNDPNMIKAKGDVSSKQPAICNCLPCKCDPCADPNAKRNTEKESKADSPRDEGSCLCNPCQCDSNKKGSPEGKLPCDCPVCYCKPCGDPNVKGVGNSNTPLRDNIEPSSKCICEKCICDDSKVTEIDDKKKCICTICSCAENAENKSTSLQKKDSKLNCKCPKCICPDCTADTPAEAIKCHCERCTCNDCVWKSTVGAPGAQNSPTLGYTCHCSPCKCDQCSDNKKEKESGITKDVKSDIQKETCICTTCDCPDTKTDDKAVNCACVECACPSCPYGDGKQYLGKAICRCGTCTCVDCTTKSEKTSEESKNSNLNKNICHCSPCTCVGCMFAEKKPDKKDDSQVLEFKCTCLELPMGRSNKANAKPDIDKFINPPQPECRANANYLSYGCQILRNNNFQEFEIPKRLQSPSRDKSNRFELESLFNSIPERLTVKKKKKKHKTTDLDQYPHRNMPPHSELLLPQAKIKPIEYVGCMSEQIKNFMNKSHEKHYYEANTGDYASKLDKYRENVRVIKNSLKKIENNKKNSKENKPFVKSISDFTETMSELGIAFDYLRKNCKPNDEVIKAITKEIKRHTSSTTFMNLFNKSEKRTKHFVPEKNEGQPLPRRSYDNPTRTSAPTIPVLQPTQVSVRPASAAPGQHRPGQVCHCSVCTGPSPDLMCYSGDTKIKHKQSKLVRTINYERTTSFVSNSRPVGKNFTRLSSQQFSTKDSECYFIPQSDHSITKINRTYDINQEGCEDSLEMMNPLLVKQASSFGLSTLSGLKVAVTTLEAKLRAKDKIIEETTHKLKHYLSSSVLTSFMNRLEGIPRYIEADEPKKSIRNAETQIERSVNDKKGVPCKCGKIHKDNKHVNLRGFRVVNIKRITVDSIIIEWKAPKSKSVTGYEIEINGQNKSRILSGWRTCAMVHSVEMSSALNISIYALTPCGRCHPPARAIYEIKLKEK